MLLSSASPVFKALFGPHFREGQQPRTASDPVEIALPDDDSSAMTNICQLLHFRSASLVDLTAGGTFESWVLSFAITADKYALREAVYGHAGLLLFTWLDQHKNCKDVVALGNIIAASYLLGHARTFQLATEQLIQQSNDDLSALFCEESRNIIPGIAFGTSDCCLL